MAIEESLAQASNVLVYSAMAVYTGALLAFATDLSGRSAPGRRATAEESAALAAEPATAPVEVQLAGARSGAGVASPAAPSDSVGFAAAAPSGPNRPPAGVTPVGRSRAAGIAVSLTWLAAALHVGGVLSRALAVQRVPWGNMYEFAVAGSAVVAVVYLGALLRRDLRYLGAFVVGPVLLTLGLAVAVFYTEAAGLVPALDSYWLIVHVSVAFISSALFTLGFSTVVLQQIQQHRQDRRAIGSPPRRGRFMDGLPPAAELERSAYRLHAVAFVLWGFTLVAGAIWAERAWGRYWGWDPKEVWTFIIWVVYAGYLHARLTRGWGGRTAAYLAYAGYACLLFNFLGVNTLLVGLHSYA